MNLFSREGGSPIFPAAVPGSAPAFARDRSGQIGRPHGQLMCTVLVTRCAAMPSGPSSDP